MINPIYKIHKLIHYYCQAFYVRYNRFKFRYHQIQFGQNMQVYNRIYLKIHPGSTVTIGDDFVFTSGDAHNPLSRNLCGCIYTAFPHSTISIGNETGISSACLWANTKISIGNRVSIGADCMLLDTDAHNLDYKIRNSGMRDENGVSIDRQTAATAPIVIEDDVLIGTRCIVLKGVTIGARSVIGSGSVVIHSIPSDCIAAGNPCKVIRKLP